MKKSPLRRKSKSTTSKLQKKCDTLLQSLIYKYPACEVCGQPPSCFHHYFPKSTSARLRYDFDNLIPICQGCHMRHHQAGDPRIHATIIQSRGGMKWHNKLLKKKQELINISVEYYKSVYEKLEKL